MVCNTFCIAVAGISRNFMIHKALTSYCLCISSRIHLPTRGCWKCRHSGPTPDCLTGSPVYQVLRQFSWKFKDEEPWPPCLDGRGRGGCARSAACVPRRLPLGKQSQKGFYFTLRQMPWGMANETVGDWYKGSVQSRRLNPQEKKEGTLGHRTEVPIQGQNLLFPQEILNSTLILSTNWTPSDYLEYSPLFKSTDHRL